MESGLFSDKAGLAADKAELVLPGERVDELQCRGLRLIQSPAAFRFGTDSVLLTHFALRALKNAAKDARVADLGAGSGAIALLIAAKTGLSVTAVEIDAEQCSRLERSLALNGLTGPSESRESNESNESNESKTQSETGAANGIGRVEVVCADFLEKPPANAKKFDHAVCNPPYFRAGSGGAPKHPGATHESSADIRSLASAVRARLKFGGSFSLCFPAERLSEAMTALSLNALEPKVLRLVRTAAGKRPYLALIRAKHGAKPGLVIEDELVLLDECGAYTEEVRGYYDGE
ncbi:MAG: methyltransferase [Clostridia bacterium]|nr:methyltransferase [Clostridia bacterium]